VSVAEIVGGIALAAGAAACFDGAVAVQATEARALRVERVGAGLLGGLLRRPRWLAATGLAILGWPLQIAALSLAPLTVVQPTLALGLVLLLCLGHRILGEPVHRRDLAAVAGIALGLGLLAWAAPENGHGHAGAATTAVVLGALALAAAAPWLLPRRLPSTALVIAAGCGFGASALTSKLLADALAAGDLTAALGWGAATAAVAGLAMVDDMAALQTTVAARAAGGAFALETALPVLLAPVVVGESWSATPLGGGVIVAGLALVLGGAAVLGSAPAVSRLSALSAGAGR
jgi:drug/metabolite transporter (DMT)-like permease